ncbi:hypothetical protein MHI48_08065 [Paenibacillus sp. FSL H7-0942]|uniref:hypothetical protein n=1 Tax=Paenibacillus TaxID=44249 RepID=UPI0009701AF3|nr:hypothetical protein [Paenibacillus amylolyticus]OMF10100.1 hypothetical protein BK129_04545 [Paenibacillus amylolyticus]
MKKMIIVTLALSLVSASLAFAATSAPQKISIFLNGKELKTRAGTEVKIIDNHAYIPASVLRDARFAVEYKNSKLNLVNSYSHYTKNLIEMHLSNHEFTSKFNKIEQEVVDVLSKVILEEQVDISRLQQLIKEAEFKGWIRPEVFTPVQDYNSFDFSDAGYSVEAYKKASIELIAYVHTGDKERLKSFHEERKKALEYYDSYTYMYDRIFKLSYISATK